MQVHLISLMFFLEITDNTSEIVKDRDSVTTGH